MAYSVIRTESFEESYDKAIGYLLTSVKSREAAVHLVDEVARVVGVLKVTPFINAISSKPYLARFNLREHYFMNYVIVYSVEGDEITLVNLFHQSQNYESADHWV